MKLSRSRFQNASIHALLLAAASSSVLAFAAPAKAEEAHGGRLLNQSVGHIHNEIFALQPNVEYTIETLGLSTGADTVLHVQENATGNFIAGNDDYVGDRRSLVTIPAATFSRSVRIIVRAYSQYSEGTATLRISSSGGAIAKPISFQAGFTKSLASFKTASHFFTIEEQGSLDDTILLVTSGNVARAIAFDDDNGMGFMSWVHVNEACTSQCKVIVGGYDNDTGQTSFMWDMDRHEANTDNDLDGMSDDFETAVGTNPAVADTDSDGLNDGEDTMGKDGADWALTRFPYFGSSPLRKDLFVQADWGKCVPKDNNDYSCGNPLNPDADTYRMPGNVAVGVAALYAGGPALYAPDVAVHIDNGVANNDPATWFKYGAWGGASQHSEPTNDDRCQWRDSARVGYFHSFRSFGWGGGSSQSPGTCGDFVGPHTVNAAHEIGHNLNLSHGGAQSGSMDVNCKPNYASLMSYAGGNVPTPAFSHREFGDLTLNPSSVIETQGLGLPPNPALLAFLDSPDLKFKYDPNTGAVDWNRDGEYSSTPIRAGLTWGWGSGGGCGTAGYQRSDGTAGSQSSALAWLPGTVPTLYWFNRTANGGMEYRTATTFPDNCGPTPAADCVTNWSSSSPVPGGYTNTLAPAAVSYLSSTNVNTLMLFQVGGAGLYAQTKTSSGPWSSLTSVGTSAIAPSAVNFDGKVWVFGSNQGQLTRSIFTPSTSSWSSPELQVWDDNSTLIADLGIATAVGYSRNGSSSTKSVFAAIPVGGMDGQVELAMNIPGTNRWRRLPDQAWVQDGSYYPTKPFTKAQPALAYVPFSSADQTRGRFYIGWNPKDVWNTDTNTWNASALLMVQTEGNDESATATTRRFVFNNPPPMVSDVWHFGEGNLSMLFDSRFDTSLRGAWSFIGELGATPLPKFAPFMDGTFNNILKDQDDRIPMKANLACSLNGQPCM